MPSKNSNIQLLKRLWVHITPRRRGQFALLMLLMVIASFAEIISIGAVLPFLTVLTNPQRVFEHSLAQPFIGFFGFTEPDQLLLPLTVTFGIVALIAGAMRLLLLWFSTRLSYAAGADLSINIYRRTLYQPYAVHVARNSSEIINGITMKTSAVIGTITMIITLIGSSVLMIFILIGLLSVDPLIAMSSFVGFGFIYAIIIWSTRKQLSINSKRIAKESTFLIKALQEGLGGIRDVLIDGSQETYCKIYRNADIPLRRAQGSSTFIAGSPRYGMEALGMLLISTLAYFIAQQDDGISKAIPILGVLALGAQRLLPVLQQAYSALSVIQARKDSLQDTIELLEQPLPDYLSHPIENTLQFNHTISINELSFRYSDRTPWVLKNLNLSIPKGSCVGFIGTTGSGKSSLLDIIMGMLQPTEGTLQIDDCTITPKNQRAWQVHVAHVPQAIFLADSTIGENIAFGVEKDKIDHKRVLLAAQQAKIADIIETWPEKYNTFVGERGVRLSGGQRQRIGIARALYKQADVIIFDEATSSLDSETENEVMQAIDSLNDDLTILIIAHRLTTLKNCTQIVELCDGRINQVGNYNELVKIIR